MAPSKSEDIVLEADNRLAVKQLVNQVQKLHALPLWEQMTKLNPPAPNPSAIPYIWRYKDIRPSLEQAGKLVTEAQAERRVLMLVNPSRGQCMVNRLCIWQHFDPLPRSSIHNRYPICWFTAGHAK